MTTEAEEFKKQEERFKALKKMFDDKFKPGLSYKIICHSEDRRVETTDSYTADFHIDKRGLPKYESYYYRQPSEALRALNDRLELALRGKTNG